MPSFEHGNAGAQPRRLERDGQPGKSGADDADVDVEVEGKPRALCGGVGSLVYACGSLAHAVFMETFSYAAFS